MRLYKPNINTIYYHKGNSSDIFIEGSGNTTINYTYPYTPSNLANFDNCIIKSTSGDTYYVSLNNESITSLGLTSAFTCSISCWINFSELPTTGAPWICNIEHTDGINKWIMGLAYQGPGALGGHDYYFYFPNATISESYAHTAITNTWYNFIITQELPNIHKLYVNGNYICSGTSSLQYTKSSYSPRILYSFNLAGKYSEHIIENICWTPTQVLNLYNSYRNFNKKISSGVVI
jgi:hypothetical protein